MLAIQQKRSGRTMSLIITLIACLLLASGGYMLVLVASPTIAPLGAMKPIDIKTVEKPQPNENRIIIPRIGVNIRYEPGEAALDRGAQWRHPDRGNPETGGNFIIAAHRFSIQPTPQGTIEKSPFYHIDKLVVEDNIFVDYNGARYAYKIDNIFDVKPTQIEIEAPSSTAKLTLYSCELGGAEAGRVVITGKLLGKVDVDSV